MFDAEIQAKLAPLLAAMLEKNAEMCRLEGETAALQRRMLDVACEWGDLQILAKEAMGHGPFGAWQENELAPLVKRAKKTLELYKSIAEHWDKVIAPVLAQIKDEGAGLSINDARDLITQSKKRGKPRKRSADRAESIKEARRIWSDATLTVAQKEWKTQLLHKVTEFLRVQTAPRRKRVGCVASSFFDSGAYSVYEGKQELGVSPEEYRDQYAEFVNRRSNQAGIDLYANFDVIGDPERTWENQRYLEAFHKCKPVPVVHFAPNDDLKWLNHYIDHGYSYIGLGGLVRLTKRKDVKEWIANCFELVEKRSTAERPIKLHGFGVGTFDLMARHPWHTVDTAGWTKLSQHSVYVPRWNEDGFRFDIAPLTVRMTRWRNEKKPARSVKFYADMNEHDQAQVRRWIESIKVRFGEQDEYGNKVRNGVLTHYDTRRVANIHYLQRLGEALGLRVYFSGDGGTRTHPEITLGDKANVMLSFFELQKRDPDTHKKTNTKRFRDILRARQRRREVSA